MPKNSLRAQLLQLRSQMPADLALRQSLAVQQRFLALPEFAAARTVALYSPIRDEVGTSAILEELLAQGKIPLFPRLVGSHLEFVAVSDPAQMLPGRFGIPEPQGGEAVPLAGIELMAVPGVGFDRSGHRIGYGKGYYDRLLQHRRQGGCLVGLAFDLQLIDRLPAEGHDVRMDLVLTASQELRFTHSSLATAGEPSPRKGGS